MGIGPWIVIRKFTQVGKNMESSGRKDSHGGLKVVVEIMVLKSGLRKGGPSLEVTEDGSTS